MIRKFCTKDTEKILNIWLEASLAAHDFVPQTYWQKMLPIVRDYYLPSAQVLVFEDKRKIKGFLALLDNRHIGALFVKPEFQGHKIGSKLLKRVQKMSSHLTLKVFAKNKSALTFYQKNDFKIISEQISPDTKETELMMSWALGCKSGYRKRFYGDS